MKERTLTLKTASGCRRLIALFIGIIAVCLLFARLISTDFGNVKNEQIMIDSRGAQISAELYYPVGASDDDNYPAIVLTHGGGVNYNVMRPMALELARRGFVVLNMSFYGSGLSEMPEYDEGGQDLSESYNEAATPGGQIDAIRYLQSLSFVDETRIGLAGHSAGAVRALATAKTDGIYYSKNDLLINVLYDEFNQKFTEEEIYQDAYKLAKDRLNDDQYKLFEVLAAEKETYFDTRVKTVISIGTVRPLPTQTVSVAGYDVTRSLKVNWFCCWGDYQKNAAASATKDEYKSANYTSEAIQSDCYYILDDKTQTSSIVSDLDSRSDVLSEAADARTLRGVGFSTETHSQNFFSINTNANVINIFGATLNNESALDDNSQIWMYRVALTGIAMLAMFALSFPIVSLIIRRPFFQECVGTVNPEKSPKFNKKLYWIMALVTVAATAFAEYKAQLAGPFPTFMSKIFTTYFVGQIQGREFIHWAGIFGLVTLVVFTIFNKKKNGTTGLACINNGVKYTGILKSMLIGAIYLGLMYTLTLITNYLFYEDFRFWNVYFGLVNVEDWFTIFPWFVDLFLFQILINASLNYTVRTDIPEWKDTLITVVINSLGVYLMFAVSRIYNATAFNVKQLIDFDSTYGLLLLVPVTTYIGRKMYKITKNIWTGAMINACLIAWHFASGGYHSILFHAQNWISTFFGL